MANVLILAGGTGLGQALLLLIAPLLTRLYDPADFGVLGAYAALVSIFAVVSALRYDLAIVLPEDDKAAINLVALCFAIVPAMLILITVATWLLWDVVALWWPKADAVRSYLWLLPLGIGAQGCCFVLNYWAVRTKQFRGIAQSKLARSAGYAVPQVGLGLLGCGATGLLAGDVVGRAAGTAALAALTLRRARASLRDISLKAMRAVAVRYRRFALLSSGAALANTLGGRLPVLLMFGFYGGQVAGWFALCERIIGMPMMLIGNSVGQVYLGQAAPFARDDPRKLLALCLHTAKRMAVLAVIPCLLLAVGGPWLTGLVFGPAWAEAGRYIQLMTLMFLVQFILLPIGHFSLIERQDLALAWNIGRLVVVVGGLVAAWACQLDALRAIGIYAATMLASYVVMFALLIYAIKRRIREHERKPAS